MLCNSTDKKAQIKWRLQLLICTTMGTSKLTTDDIISETVYLVVRMSDREFPIYFHYLVKSPPAIWWIGRNYFINLENLYNYL